MMIRILLAGWFLLPFNVFGQEDDAVRSEARRYVKTLTSTAMHGRGYVDNGDGLAADWIAQQFARLGLKPLKTDFFQPFQFNVNSFPDSLKVSVDGQQLVPGSDFIVDPASGPASGTFGLVHLEPDDMLDPARRSMAMGVLTGRAACLDLPPTKDADSLRMFHEVEQELMRFCPVVKKVDGKLTWGVAQEARPFPLIQVASPALTDSSERITIDVHNALLPRHEARNVLGWVKGRSSRWVVVGAHYDHLGHMGPDAMFPGANDNASGVAMMLTLADWFSKHKPRYNMLFVAFAGEEAGLVGSEWFVVDRPVDLSKIKLMLNLDILGTGDDGITVVNATAQQERFDQLVAINEKRKLLAQVKARGPACNSDHCPFVKRNVPALFIYTMGGITAYHDVLDKEEILPLTEFVDLHSLLKEFLTTLK
ncbi:MAG: M28 family peptidase [Flavobacteriales bacterium]|nr:M28 family peptidase [Flavobacteriales bacterium]